MQLFSRLLGAHIELAWHRREPVDTDAGFSINPTTTFEDAPQADVLMVPGGQGAFDLLKDPVALEFVRTQAAGAEYVTNVCTARSCSAPQASSPGDERRATTH